MCGQGSCPGVAGSGSPGRGFAAGWSGHRGQGTEPGEDLGEQPVSGWQAEGQVFGDDVVAAAMIDRLVHHTEVLALKGDSYRLKNRDLAASPQPPPATTDTACEWDYVVIGPGCTGSIAARKILERQPGARLLLLEQGPFLLPDHVQNLQSLYQPIMSAATASPWLSNGDLEIVGQLSYLGGRTLFWSGSSP